MMRALYTAALFVALPFTLLYLLRRSRRQPEYRRHWGERLGHFTPAADCRRVIWIHAVSVGETRAAQPLVAALRTRYPDHQLLFTHMTPTGRETSRALYPDALRRYLPYDFPFAARRFLGHFEPEFGIIMETELWPNLIAAARRRAIPLLLVNARLSEKSARGYRRFARLTHDALRGLTAIGAQSEADRDALIALGAREVQVTGNLKFDVELPTDVEGQAESLRQLIGPRASWVAASTREGEEALLLDALAPNADENALLILVPRHPQRFDEVAQLLKRRGVRYQRRSANTAIDAQTRVLLGDSMGELHRYYAVAEFAFIGGSLRPFGGQNLIEACALGKPVLFGPYTFNFAAAAQAAIDCGAALRVRDAHELVKEAARLLAGPEERARMAKAALEFASAHRGATARTMAMIEAVLREAASPLTAGVRPNQPQNPGSRLPPG